MSSLATSPHVDAVYNTDGAPAAQRAQAGQERARRLAIAKRRQYLAGEQYDWDNEQTASQFTPPIDLAAGERLPEHHRKHAYSTHIAECCWFLADQLMEGFSYTADRAVADVLDAALRASPQLTGQTESDEPSLHDPILEALTAGDVPVLLRWDPVAETVWYELWESEAVQCFGDTRRLTKVVRDDRVWVGDGETAKEVCERVVYEVRDGSCVAETFHDDVSVGVVALGVPFVPWVLLRAGAHGLRGLRGKPVITDQALAHADRYNANEQVAWLIARYNSHANMVVEGDQMNLSVQQSQRLEKDVFDIITVPSGTNVNGVSLPTDPAMIEHQRQVLAEAQYSSFGLVRVDPDTVSGFNGASGYALEILNRRTDGTFRRIRRNLVRDLASLFQATLDMHEAMLRPSSLTVAEDGSLVEQGVSMFPDRKIEITFGTGYIVDDVRVRDDYTAGLVSRASALRDRGKTPDEIDEIQREIDREQGGAEAAPTFTTGTSAGSTVAGTTGRP